MSKSCPYISDCYSYYSSSIFTVPTDFIVGAICCVLGFITLISLILLWCYLRTMQRALRNQAITNQTILRQNTKGMMNMMNMQPSFNPMMQQPPMMQQLVWVHTQA